jgi:16S rRNA processing protein RimM
MVIALFEEVSSVGMAMALKNSIVCIDRGDVELEEGAYFLADIIGLPVFDEASGAEIGTLSDVLEYPASRVFVVKGETERLIPDVPEFIKKVDVGGGRITVRLIEGM